MQKIAVELSERSYDIRVEAGLLAKLEDILTPHLAGRNCLIITDDNVNGIYGDQVQKAANAAASRAELISIPAGEAQKNLATVENLYHAAVESELDRSSMIIALGGGVPGDIAGFVAASYMRGIEFIQIPTSLLAMVDSSVGGKTGVDLPEGKNLVGAFWQPKLVLIDPEVLKTLPERELRCGLAEVVKYGMIMDDDFFAKLVDNVALLNKLDLDFYAEIIAHCCQLKAQVVAKDEREGGLRAILNYGHTFGHAVEAVTGYAQLAHGEAVAIGMAMAANFAVAEGRLPESDRIKQQELLAALALPATVAGIEPEAVVQAMSRDKKVKTGEVRLVLPDRIGNVSVVKEVAADQVLEAVRSCCE